MENVNNTKTCAFCKHFTRYYEKTYCHFYRTKQGYCDIQKNLVDGHYNCEQWRHKYPRNRNKDNSMVKKALENALLNVSVLAQIFGDEDERNY